MEEKFSTFKIEHALRNENRFVDALAALGSQIIFKGSSTRIEVSKREESIIEVLKEKFREEQDEVIGHKLNNPLWQNLIN